MAENAAPMAQKHFQLETWKVQMSALDLRSNLGSLLLDVGIPLGMSAFHTRSWRSTGDVGVSHAESALHRWSREKERKANVEMSNYKNTSQQKERT